MPQILNLSNQSFNSNILKTNLRPVQNTDLNISTRPSLIIKNNSGLTINKTNPTTFQFTKSTNTCKY
jgi:hypothetical protein